MLAYFCVAGKQFMASKGDIITDCPFVKGQVGDIVFVDKVIGIGDKFGDSGDSFIKGAKIELKIVKQGIAKKLQIVNFKPQKRHEKWKGFRRKYTNLEVLEIHWSK